VALLTLVAFGLATLGQYEPFSVWLLVSGLCLFGVVFAINSSLHSYLIVQYADRNAVSMDVGFYYMANASGRLLGTVLSGWVYQSQGLVACLWVSVLFLLIASVLSIGLPQQSSRMSEY
jgi:predicted MFS family arabinose efflux permease